METTHSNSNGNRVLKVYGKLETVSKFHYEAELFIGGVSQGLEAITAAQIQNRYPILVEASLSKTIRMGA